MSCREIEEVQDYIDTDLLIPLIAMVQSATVSFRMLHVSTLVVSVIGSGVIKLVLSLRGSTL